MGTRAHATAKKTAASARPQGRQRPVQPQSAGTEGARFEFSRVPIEPAIQRKCAGCDGPAQDDDEQCPKCEGKVARRAAGAGPAPPTPPTLPVSEPGDRLEVEADRAADQALRVLDGGAPPALPDATRGTPIVPLLQREAAEQAPAEQAPAAQTATAQAPAEETPAGLIVDDEAQSLTAGQMHKSEFLAALKSEACAAADRELARVGRDTSGCPLVERWLDYYQGRDPSQLERAIRKFAPGAAGARTAQDYIPIVSARVASGVAQWATTGQIPADVPPELRNAAAGADPMGGALSAIGGVLSSIGGAIGGAISSIGSLLFKSDSGGRAGVDRAALSSRLGPGAPLEGGARSRMETAYGYSFANVRVHADAGGAALSRDLDAHAFTLGEHVAFAAGQYRPGTPAGDALLAHELAHVIQQGGDGGPAASAVEVSRHNEPAEREADSAAVSAMASIYAPDVGVPRKSMRRKSGAGLRLQRCGASMSTLNTPMTTARSTERGSGEGQGTLPPLQQGESDHSYSVDEFIAYWEAQHGGQRMPESLRQVLYGGCIGITALNLGEGTYGPGHPPMSFCYNSLANAQRAQSQFQASMGVRPYIFGKHFYSAGRAYTPDSTGRIDMRQHDFFSYRSYGTSGGTFDYGWYDEANNTFIDASHCDSRAPGCNTSEAMRIIQNTPQAWASQVQPGTNYDTGVYCLWHPSWPSTWRIGN